MIKIATTYYGDISPETKVSIRALLDSDIDCYFESVESCYICKGRNRLINEGASQNVKQRLDFKWDYILFVDSDIEFSVENVRQLLKHNAPIVSGSYVTREHNKYCCGGFNAQNKMTFAPLTKQGLSIEAWCGGGFVLIKKEVFEKTDYPWFRMLLKSYVDSNGAKCQFMSGEDFGFCENARVHGYNILVDYDCKVKHLI